MVWALWLANIVLDTGGQLAFKRAASFAGWRDPQRLTWVGLGASCYVLELAAWIAFLSLVPLSRGVLLGSINIVTVAIAGRLLFAEAWSVRRVTGMALIAVGVAVVGLDGF
jgi:multidrug transporter EmrE-like cation transporter